MSAGSDDSYGAFGCSGSTSTEEANGQTATLNRERRAPIAQLRLNVEPVNLASAGRAIEVGDLNELRARQGVESRGRVHVRGGRPSRVQPFERVVRDGCGAVDWE